MRRREQREHIFKLLFMTEFNSEEEMSEQLSLYFGPPTSTRSMAAKVGTKIVLMNDICKDCYDWLTKELKCRRELYENAE